MNREATDQGEILEAQFKNQVFASNPDLYKSLFLDRKDEDDFEIEEYLPETEEDVMKMLEEVRRAL